MESTSTLWIGFSIFVVVMLVLDLGVLNRKAHIIKFREAILFSVFWVVLAGIFAVFLHHFRGAELLSGLESPDPGLEFATGYLIELSLSVDNLFVFLLLFTYFKVPALYQHKILFWGIIGAIVFRLSFILLGIGLINRFHWLIYVFGAFLIFTGLKLAHGSDDEVHPERNPVLNIVRRFLPITSDYVEGNFFTREAGKLMGTPMFIVLVAVETTDIVFAVDSIPAILAITRDPFVAFSSNVFAILGLRSLYFALAGMMELFSYLNYGLAVVLIFVGTKMILPAINEDWKVPTTISLMVVGAVLAFSVLLSILLPPRNKREIPRDEDPAE